MSALTTLLIVLTLAAPAPRAATPQVQTPQQQAPAPDKADADRPEQATLARYMLGPQDQLKITVFDEPDLTNIYRVDSDGFVSFPLINRVAASGLTVSEFPPAAVAQMRERLKPVVDKYSKDVGEAMVNEMLAEIEKVRGRK